MRSHSEFAVSRVAVRRFLLESQSLWPGGDGATLSAEERVTPPAQGSVALSGAMEPLAPERLIELIRRLECVQLDPVAAVARNHHLVLHARLPDYAPEDLDTLLAKRDIFEYEANAASILPIEDYPTVEGIRRRWAARAKPELDRFAAVAARVLAQLEAEGPLPARAFTASARVNGYWDNQAPKTKDTSHVLNLLRDAGEITVVGRNRLDRLFDLASRAIPKPWLSTAKNTDTDAANEALLDKYLRAFSVFDTGDFRFGWRKIPASERQRMVAARVADGLIVPLRVEDVRRPYYILAEDLDRLQRHARDAREKRSHSARSGGQTSDSLADFEGPVRFLPPLDNLLWRRERIADLFGFSYTWEIYLPQEKRQFGYYAMPILAGDRLIGRIDPKLDRERKILVIRLLQFEPGVSLTPRLRHALRDGLDTFASFHQAREIVIDRTIPNSPESIDGFISNNMLL